MSNTPAFPYDTRLNVLHEALELIDVPRLVQANTHPWYNQTLCRVNDAVVRLGVVQGEYHWHSHADDDEFFYVVEGCFIIDLEDRTGRHAAGEPRLPRPQSGHRISRLVRRRPRTCARAPGTPP